MTCIAYRNGVLAADSALTGGRLQFSSTSPKIIKLVDGRLAGAAGESTFVHAFLTWAGGDMKGVPPKSVKGTDNIGTGLIIALDGTISVHEGDGNFDARTTYYAIGSGEFVATGAMFAGAGPERAVEAAIQHDTGCCGPVIALSLGPA